MTKFPQSSSSLTIDFCPAHFQRELDFLLGSKKKRLLTTRSFLPKEEGKILDRNYKKVKKKSQRKFKKKIMND